MSNKRPTRGREKAWFAVLLAWTAGGIDAVGFLLLYHLFTAHMSGNSAAAAAYAGRGEWPEALRRAFPIPLFVAGVFFGAVLVDSRTKRRVRSPFCAAFGLEALLLISFWHFGGAVSQGAKLRNGSLVFYSLVALPALAMGLQNATLRRVGDTGVRTTYITGMLTSFAENCAACVLWLCARTRGRGLRRFWLALRVLPRAHDARHLGLYIGIWLGYICGAIPAARLELSFRWNALLLPICGLAVAIMWELTRCLGAVPSTHVETP